MRSINSGLRDGKSNQLALPEGSTSASALRADDVSMTKVTLHADEAAVSANVLKLDQCRPRRIQPVAPLHDDGTLISQLI
jgi:hypothetical protein